MRMEYEFALFSDLTGILWETRKKNYFALRGKVPFITERLEPKLHCL
jgi:hypothetical protein